VHPRRDPANPLTGVFATRAPVRPNLIGMCACRLVKVEGNVVDVTGLDALQDSPILDIKPYIPGNDAVPDAQAPAWVAKIEKEPHPKPPGAGRSSFDLIDQARFFAEMNLKPGSTLLDLGCGPGFYTLAAADIIGPQGAIYAIDLWGEGIARLKEQAAARGYRQIRAVVADASKELPIKAGRVDVCLMATVLHDLVEAGTARGALTQVARVLKPGGVLAIVEFKKIEGPPGPPLKIRLAPEEVERLVNPYGFRPVGPAMEVGPYNYLLRFVKEGK
jgi:SAM-dependent methyltransferase